MNDLTMCTLKTLILQEHLYTIYKIHVKHLTKGIRPSHIAYNISLKLHRLYIDNLYKLHFKLSSNKSKFKNDGNIDRNTYTGNDIRY